MFVYREVVFRMRQGESLRSISRSLGMGRNTLKAIRQYAQGQGWLAPEGLLPVEEELVRVFGELPVPAQQVSSVAPYREQVQAWLKEGIQVKTIFSALKRSHGYVGSYGSVLRFARVLAPKHPEAFVPLEFKPGEAAQVDFGQGPLLLDPAAGLLRKSWLFVMTLCFSRHMFVCFVFDQSVPTWLLCHQRAFEFFCGVSGKVILDNPKAAIVKACYRDPEVQKSYYEFAQAYGFVISPCKVATPEHKGRVESGVKYVKGSFLPLRAFLDIHDADRQALAWCVEEAGSRIHGRTFQKPFEVFTAIEKSALNPLPLERFETPTWKKVTVHADCHVVFRKIFYSIPFRFVGKVLWLRACDTTVQIFEEHQRIAIHSKGKRPGQRVTLEEHLPPEKVAWLMKTPQWCLKRSAEVGPFCRTFIERLLGDKVLDRLRAAQGVLGLGDEKKYGALRLEAACKRALRYESIGYRVVENILKRRLDQAEQFCEEGADPIADPRFGRPIGALLSCQN